VLQILRPEQVMRAVPLGMLVKASKLEDTSTEHGNVQDKNTRHNPTQVPAYASLHGTSGKIGKNISESDPQMFLLKTRHAVT
jgi:hypothetical protein